MWSTRVEDEMAITKNEWQKIEESIQQAVRPNGWKKAIYWLREWGMVAVPITAVCALLGVAVALGVTAFNRVEENAKFRQRTDDRLGSIELKMASLLVSVTASQPFIHQNQITAKEIIDDAKKKNLKIPEPIVEQAGLSFIQAAKTEPRAWEVALEFISYRSSLNSEGNKDVLSIHRSSENVTVYDPGPVPPGQKDGALKTGPFVAPPEQAAHWDHIGRDQNTGVKLQPAWLFAEGGAVTLDGEQLKNVVFDRVEIHYSGKPTVLNNVIFVNCTFVMDNSDPGRRLGEQLLASSAVNFRNAA